MGKDTTTKSISSHRLYSPWLMNDHTALQMGGFGYFSKTEEIEDTDISQTISELEKEQIKGIQDRKEEDEVAEDILYQARNLKLHHTASDIFIPESDLQLESTIKIPETQQTTLLTLKEHISTKEKKDLHPLCASDPKVVKVYKKIGFQLSRYHLVKKLPKAFRIIPSLSNWDEILLLTNPTHWTPQAIYDTTLLFITQLHSVRTKLFYQFVLLPLTRQHMTGGQLAPPILLALQKSMASHPRLFMKGFIFPLCDSKSCTMQEATLLASIIADTKMTRIDPPTALVYLAEQPVTLPVSLIVLALFMKKNQFISFRTVQMIASHYFCNKYNHQLLPSLWYRSLLLFITTCSCDLAPVFKKRIVVFMDSAPQNDITEAIREVCGKWGPTIRFYEQDSSDEMALDE